MYILQSYMELLGLKWKGRSCTTTRECGRAARIRPKTLLCVVSAYLPCLPEPPEYQKLGQHPKIKGLTVAFGWFGRPGNQHEVLLEGN